MKPKRFSQNLLGTALTLAFSVPFLAESASAANAWDGGAGTGNWNDASNWDNDIVPTGTPALTFAGTNQLSTTNNTTLTQVNGFTFSANAGAFTLGGTGLNLGGSITNLSTNPQTFTLPFALVTNTTVIGAGAGASVTLGAVTNSANNRTITNSLAAGNTLTLGSIVLSEAAATARNLTINGTGVTTVTGIISNGSTSGSNLIYSGTGTLNLQGANSYTGTSAFNSGTVNITGASATTGAITLGLGATLNITGANAGTSSLTVNGTATISGANGNTGATLVNGTGVLNLSYTTQDNSKLADLAVLTLANGTVNLIDGTHSEAVFSSIINAGSSKINRTSGSAVLNLNGIARNAGATVNFGAASIAATDTNNLGGNGILGGYATVGLTDWATSVNTGAADTAITAFSAYTTTAESTWLAANNVALTDGTTLTANRTINSLKVLTSTTGQSLNVGLNQNLTLNTGGLLFTGANDYSITGGTLKSATAGNSDLIIHQNGAGALTIGSIIANGNGVSTLTKTGTGTLILSAANSYTGANFIHEGTLRLGANGGIGTAVAGSALNVATGSLLDLNGFNQTLSSLGGSGVVTSSSGGTLTLTSNGAYTAALTGNLSVILANTTEISWGGPNQSYTGGTTLKYGIRINTSPSGASSIFGTGPITLDSAVPVRFYFNNGGYTFLNDLITTPNTGNHTWSANGGNNTFNGAFTGSGVINLGNSSYTFGGIWNGSGATPTSNTAFAGSIVIGSGTSNATVNLTNPTASSTAARYIFGNAGNATAGLLLTAGTGTATATYNLGEISTATGVTNATLRGAAVGTTTFSVGAQNTSSSFAGTITNGTVVTHITALSKVGTGTLTLSGANTYTGATTIDAGTLAIVGPSFGLSPITVNVGGTLTGSTTLPGSVTAAGTISPGAGLGEMDIGATTLTGTLAVDVSSTASDLLIITGNLNLSGATLVVSETEPVAEGSSYTIAATTGSVIGTFANVPSNYTVAYDNNDSVVIRKESAATGYDAWKVANGLDASNNGINQDPDNDGIQNLLEFVLGGLPVGTGAGNTSILPTQTLTSTDLVFTYFRSQNSVSGVTQVVEWNTDLSSTWNTITVPSATSGSTVVLANTPSSGTDKVTVTIPRGSNTKLFARLKVTQNP